MIWFWVGVVITLLWDRVTAEYRCTMKSFEVTCIGISAVQIPQDITVTLNKSDTSTMNITNGIISTISATTFKGFANLQSLYITDSGVSNLEDDAFSGSLDLQDLSLSNNALTEFNLRALPPENNLKRLDLSYNSLTDFSSFNVSFFPRLVVLNLAGNLLTYLPTEVLKLLEMQSEFYIIVHDNPWDCSHPEWAESLSEKLKNSFCVNKTYKPKTIISELSETTYNYDVTEVEQPLINEFELENRTEKMPEESCEKPNCLTCSFYYCFWWLFCGTWIGIILGNFPRIRSLICTRPVTYTDGHTQCEFSLVEQHIYTDSKSHKLTPSTIQNKEKA